MKKVYEKPSIIIENFSLTTSVASNCENKTNTPSQGACALIWEDEFLGKIEVFYSTMGACKTHEDDGEYNGICYHVPSESYNLFNS